MYSFHVIGLNIFCVKFSKTPFTMLKEWQVGGLFKLPQLVKKYDDLYFVLPGLAFIYNYLLYTCFSQIT